MANSPFCRAAPEMPSADKEAASSMQAIDRRSGALSDSASSGSVVIAWRSARSTARCGRSAS
jgi:hypothetical protein